MLFALNTHDDPANGHSVSMGVWTPAGYSRTATYQSGTSSVVETSTADIGKVVDAADEKMTYTITSVTDTGFTVTETETGDFTLKSNGVTWTAEGEL
jgi:hypothetical protein